MVYLYGPPAVGTYTVAAEIARRTGYRLFDNHLTIDPVKAVFPFGSDPFWRLVHLMRESVMAEAAGAGIDLVFTTVYDHPGSLPQTLRRFRAVEQHGGRVCPVQLTCPVTVLRTRIGSDQRRAMGKVATSEGLDEILRSDGVFGPIPGRGSLRLDTSDLEPAEAARRIVDHFGLESSGGARDRVAPQAGPDSP
jgi:chloramphenicol 3-O-phosphotransferase